MTCTGTRGDCGDDGCIVSSLRQAGITSPMRHGHPCRARSKARVTVSTKSSLALAHSQVANLKPCLNPIEQKQVLASIQIQLYGAASGDEHGLDRLALLHDLACCVCVRERHGVVCEMQSESGFRRRWFLNTHLYLKPSYPSN